MIMHRRRFLTSTAGAAAALPFLGLVAEAKSASRAYVAYRGSSNVGRQQLDIARSGDTVTVNISTRLRVKLLGVTVYRYDLDSSEVWEGGVLQRIAAKGSDNGKPHFANATRTGAGLQIEGSRFNGVVGGNPASTSAFLPEIVTRSTWISTLTGKPINVASSKRGQATLNLPGGAIACTHYHCGGELKLPLDVYFTPSGELAAYMFDAKGERARVIAQSLEPGMRPLWG